MPAQGSLEFDADPAALGKLRSWVWRRIQVSVQLEDGTVLASKRSWRAYDNNDESAEAKNPDLDAPADKVEVEDSGSDAEQLVVSEPEPPAPSEDVEEEAPEPEPEAEVEEALEPTGEPEPSGPVSDDEADEYASGKFARDLRDELEEMGLPTAFPNKREGARAILEARRA